MREVAVKEAETDAPPRRASGGEKLAEWEIKAPRVKNRAGVIPEGPTAEPSTGSRD
jgi:hypothetical protein